MSLTDFAHPWWLLFLIVPVLVSIGYIAAQRSKQRRTVAFGNLSSMQQAVGKSRGWPTHVPAVLLICSLVFLTVALGAPQKEQKVPRNRATVMLVIDVSLSMMATDIEPSRLDAAQQAGKQFAENLTPGVNLGLVSFAGTASMLVAPTTDRGPIIRAINSLELNERTATGEAIYSATRAIEIFGASLGGPEQAPPARIVLLSDGAETVPMDPYEERGAFTAARTAQEKGVPVSTISFGTRYGTVGIQGNDQPVPVDDDSLREIAQLSGGDFYTAQSLDELKAVYETLEEQIGFEFTKADASRPWLILGTLAAMVAAEIALVANRRIP